MAIPFRNPYGDEEDPQQWLSGSSPVAAAPPPGPPLTMTQSEFDAPDAPSPPPPAQPPAMAVPGPADATRPAAVIDPAVRERLGGAVVQPNPYAAPPAAADDPDRTLRMIDAGLQGIGGKAWDSRFWDKRSADRKASSATARLRDPQSPESIHRRQVLSRMLGYQPAELEGLSAADLQNFDPGKAAVSLAMARARSEEAKQTAAAKEAADTKKLTEQRSYDQTKSAEQRGYDEDKWADQNAVTSGQQDERARTIAGVSTARATDQALLADDLTRKRQIAEEERRAKTTAATEDRKAKAETDALISPEELERSNEFIEVPNKTLFRQAISNRRLTGKAIDTVKAANRGVGIVKKLAETKAEFDALSLADKASSSKGRALIRRYEAHKQEYAGVIAAVSGSNSVETHKESMDLVPDILNPYGADGIEALYSPIETNVEGSLSAYGMKLNPKGRSAGAAPHAAAAHHGAPAGPSPQPAPAGGVRVRDPKTGRTGAYRGTAKEAAADGLEVVQ